MQNLVTSKEVSEKLKKLGVRQESQFYWFDDGSTDEPYVVSTKGSVQEVYFAAYTISELKEPLKPYMKDIEISTRDDIFNPDFWGNYLISKLSEKGDE